MEQEQENISAGSKEEDNRYINHSSKQANLIGAAISTSFIQEGFVRRGYPEVENEVACGGSEGIAGVVEKVWIKINLHLITDL